MRKKTSDTQGMSSLALWHTRKSWCFDPWHTLNNLSWSTVRVFDIFFEKCKAILNNVLLSFGILYWKNLDSQALTRQLKFMNNQYIQYPLKQSLKPSESISAFRFMVRNTNWVFTMFWFSTNCKLCLTHEHDFSKTTHPAVRNSSCFFLQNFHLNLLRCRCRNTKHFSASLHNCKLVEIAITDQNAWAFGDERYESCVTLRLRDKGCTWCWFSRQKEVSVGSDEVLLWAKRLSDGSDDVLSYLYWRFNGKRVSDQRSKCWRNAHERFQWSFCGYWTYWLFMNI